MAKTVDVTEIELPEADAELMILVRVFVKLWKGKGEIEARGKIVADKIDNLGAILMRRFEEDGVASLSCEGLTVFTRRQVWSSAVDHAALALVLKDLDKAEFVKESVNSSRLSGWVREFDPEADRSPEEILEAMPEVVRELIKVREQFDMRATASKAPRKSRN